MSNSSSNFAAVVGMLMVGLFFGVFAVITLAVGLITSFWPLYIFSAASAAISGLGFYRVFTS